MARARIVRAIWAAKSNNSIIRLFRRTDASGVRLMGRAKAAYDQSTLARSSNRSARYLELSQVGMAEALDFPTRPPDKHHQDTKGD